MALPARYALGRSYYTHTMIFDEKTNRKPKFWLVINKWTFNTFFAHRLFLQVDERLFSSTISSSKA
jgi:hypothetical protein